MHVILYNLICKRFSIASCLSAQCQNSYMKMSKMFSFFHFQNRNICMPQNNTITTGKKEGRVLSVLIPLYTIPNMQLYKTQLTETHTELKYHIHFGKIKKNQWMRLTPYGIVWKYIEAGESNPVLSICIFVVMFTILPFTEICKSHKIYINGFIIHKPRGEKWDIFNNINKKKTLKSNLWFSLHKSLKIIKRNLHKTRLGKQTADSFFPLMHTRNYHSDIMKLGET